MADVACPECNTLNKIGKDYPSREAVSQACQLDKNGMCPLCKKSWGLTKDSGSGKVTQMDFISSKG